MPTDDARDAELTLGAALQAARDEAGLSVEEVAAETRIRATLIRDLEADQFGSSGGNVYARGHIKSIAASLHIDPAPLLALFDQAAGAPAPLPLASEEPLSTVALPSLGGSDFALSASAALRRERRGPRWGLALAGAASVLLALVAIGSLSGGGGPSKPASLGGPDQTPTPTSTPTSAPVQHPDLSASKAPVVGAQLRIRVIGGASWVSISNVSSTLFEGILRDGQFKDFHDTSRLKVVIGNAPVVNLNCGGKDSGQAAANNRKVLRFACTSTGLTPL